MCEIKVKFSLNRLKEKYQLRQEKHEEILSNNAETRFNIHIEENQNEQAEEELQRQIDRSDFQR